MFKMILWSGVISTTIAAALFMPIDPSLLRAVGFTDIDGNGRAAPAAEFPLSPLKIVSGRSQSAERAEITVVRGPAVSPYQAHTSGRSTANSQTSRLAGIAAAPLLQLPRATQTHAAGPIPAGVVRRLQHELRRVGCYHGRIDGDWGPASRFAMAAFTRSVNAALPTGRPDVVLLTLVRRHTGIACGRHRIAPIQTATPLVPNATVKTTRAWRARVSPARPRLAQHGSHAQGPSAQLVEAPRIVRANGRQTTPTDVAAPIQRRTAGRAQPGSAYVPFSVDSRMALGAVPVPRAARPVTTPQPAYGAPDAIQRRSAERRRYKRSRRAKRRRYQRRSRSQTWRRKVFPTLYNN